MQGITSRDEVDIAHHVRYMLNNAHFNKHDSHSFERAAIELQSSQLKRNCFDIADENLLTGYEFLFKDLNECLDLLRVTHRLVVKKIP